jgi:hypothetical protein
MAKSDFPSVLSVVRKHLRGFLLVKAEGGAELYFRFYDPRVFVPTCTPEEAHTFFGPIRAFLVEANSRRRY